MGVNPYTGVNQAKAMQEWQHAKHMRWVNGGGESPPELAVKTYENCNGCGATKLAHSRCEYCGPKPTKGATP